MQIGFPMPDTLFVYGTLHPDRAPAEVASAVKRLKKVGEGAVRGKLVDLGEYPGLLLGNAGRSTVHGSVFLLPSDPSVLAELDAYEEYNPQSPSTSLFLRKRVHVSLEDGTTRECWIYAYNPVSPAKAPKSSRQRVAQSSRRAKQNASA
jgi:gamma-glutamylcyclotransferase (GGCT)/AIG2-like uncharacterized protein YtfP